MVERTAQRGDKDHGRWSQIGISACVLLLPPVILGAYGMLPQRGEIVSGEGSTIALAVAAEPETVAVQPVADLTPPEATPVPTGRAVASGPAIPKGQAVAKAPAVSKKDIAQLPQDGATPGSGQPGAEDPAGLSAEAAAAYELAGSATEIKPEDAGDAAGDSEVARPIGPVPVRVTVVVAPRSGEANDLELPQSGREAAAPTAPRSYDERLAAMPSELASDLLANGRGTRPSHHHRRHRR